MPWPYDQQTPPWLYPAGTGAPANDEDGFDKYVRSFSQPVAPPPSFDFTDAEAADANDSPVPPIAWQPVDTAPHFDFTDAEANPPPSDLADIEIDPTNGKQPIDPYPVQVGKPRPWDPMPRETDPPSPVVDAYNAATPAQAVSPTPTPGGIIDRTLGRVADKAGTQADLAKLGASETFVDKDAPDQTPEQAQESLVDLYRRDPEARLRAEFEHANLIESERLKRETKANLDEAAAMERSAQIREQARAKAKADRAQIETEARALASAPFQRYWSNAGTAQKMGGALLAVFGGLMQSSTGGRNSGIDFMMKLADDDADAKWKAIQARREMNGEAMADADEEFRQREALRLAGREQVKNTIRAELANLDPENTQALALSGGLAQMDAAEAEYAAKQMAERAKREEEALKTADAIRKTDIEAFKAESEDEKWRTEARRKAMAGAGGGGGSRFGDKAKFSVTDWIRTDERLKPLLERYGADTVLTGKEVDDIIVRAGKLGQQGTDVSRNEKLEQDIASADRELRLGATVPTVVKDEEGKTSLKWDVLRRADGSEYLAPNATRRGELEKMLVGTTNSVRLIDDILALRKKYGWSSDLMKSPEWRRMRSDFGSLTMETKDTYGLGALAGPDVGAIHEVFGTHDATEVRDPTAGLEQMRKNLEARADTALRGAQYDGKPFRVPRPTRAKLAARDADVDRAASRGRSTMLDDGTSKVVGSAIARGGGAPLSLSTIGAMAQDVGSGQAGQGLTPQERERWASGLTQTQFDGVSTLVAKVRGNGKDADAAAQALDELATDAKTPPRVRRFAAAQLVQLATQGNAAASRLYGDEDQYDLEGAD